MIKSIFLLLQLFFVCSFSASISKPFFTVGSNDAVVFEKNSYDVPGTVCDIGKTLMTDVSLKFDPLQPAKGKNLNITVQYTLNEQITGGTSELKLKYGFLPVMDQKMELCEALKEQNESCPLEKGNGVLSASNPIPSSSPGGHYTGYMKLNDQNSREILCINLDFRL